MSETNLALSFPSNSSILIVDDQPDNLRTLSVILRRVGFTVRQAISGQIALQTAQAVPPDLILLDIGMPGMDGYEVCNQLKANALTSNIPVIFLSALSDVLDKARAFSTGGADYITKPFEAEEVLIRVQHQLRLRSQQQQLLELNRQLELFNASLERQVQARTLELDQALTFERSLKRISDQVRDTLDQNQILRTVVQELAESLEVFCCDAVLYSPDRLTSEVRYQYVQPGQVVTQGQILQMTDAPEIYEQLHQGYCFAFCQIRPTPIRNHSAILACPIVDNALEQNGMLGDLWLFKPTSSSFSTAEVRLVEQVANQCAVVLRQAKLYEASQLQVAELQHLNQLKDDFLQTISHELRSPLANMKLALQLVEILTESGQTLIEQLSEATTPNNRVSQYFAILKQECDRELQLINDLLDLQHLEAGVYATESTTINLQDWLTHVIEAFQSRTQEQQQNLELALDPEPLPITIDLSSLSRVMTELLNNACKYTPRHETITVSLHREGARMILRVGNTGVEVAAEELPRIFDKFYRIPSSDPWQYGGTGLGLALVKKLLEQLGGSIVVTSQNRVTCFTVQLPLQDTSMNEQ
jgi:signal transduction histidine kinase/DNA-binding response OmpR family regulator